MMGFSNVEENAGLERPAIRKAEGLGINATAQEIALAPSHGNTYDVIRHIAANRFGAWLNYNRVKPTGILKIKLKQAYLAGVLSCLDKDTKALIEKEIDTRP